jgi:two-component system chemotaxis sensor kinase CheA
MAERDRERLTKEFLAEVEDLLEALGRQVGSLEEGRLKGEQDPELINALFRGIHSIKGLAGMFGFREITSLTHDLESLLDRVRLGKCEVTQGIVDLLYDTVEALNALLVSVRETGESRGDVSGLVGRIQAMLDGGTGGAPASGAVAVAGPATIDAETLRTMTEYEEHRLRENVKAGRDILMIGVSFPFATFDADLTRLTSCLSQKGEVISTLPSPEAGGEDRIGFRLLFGAQKEVEEIRGCLAGFAATLSPLAMEGREASTPTPAPGLDDAGREGGEGQIRSLTQTVRVDIGKLDELMNEVGELSLAKSMVASLSAKVPPGPDGRPLAAGLASLTRFLDKRLSFLQEGIIGARMVPVEQLFSRLTRMVRKISQEAGKDVEVQTRGEDTELDKLLVEELGEPMLHLIRNAIDHGIEPEADRLAAGKAARGFIGLTAEARGNRVVITVEDDGRGINLDKTRREAIRRGLMAPGEEKGEQSLFSYLFMPGFSTRKQAGELSGRGVGLDVVKRNLIRIGGMVEIDTEPGAGTVFSLTVPITLAIIQALLVRVAGRQFAIPLNAVLEIVQLNPSSLQSIEGQEVFRFRERHLPLIRLAGHLALGEAEEAGFIIVSGLAEQKVGFVVDAILGQREVVIKPISPLVGATPGFAGATDTAEQEAILILDLGALIQEIGTEERSSGVSGVFRPH